MVRYNIKARAQRESRRQKTRDCKIPLVSRREPIVFAMVMEVIKRMFIEGLITAQLLNWNGNQSPNHEPVKSKFKDDGTIDFDDWNEEGDKNFFPKEKDKEKDKETEMDPGWSAGWDEMPAQTFDEEMDDISEMISNTL